MNNPQKFSTLFFSSQVDFLKDNFIIHDITLFKKFAEAVQKFCFFIFEIDKILDGDYHFEHEYTEDSNILYNFTKNHQEAIRLLTGIFPDHHEFWPDLDRTTFLYYQILLQEKSRNRTKEQLSQKDFYQYADAKHALAYIPVRGMSYLFESKVNTKLLENLFSDIFVAMQMNDDLEDFDSDEKNGQWTYAHSRVQDFIRENQLEESSTLEKYRERVLYVSGIWEELATLAKDKFIDAKTAAEKLELENLTEWLTNAIEMMERNEQIIKKLTAE